MQLAILIVAGALSIVGFVLLFEDIQYRKGWKEYLADMTIILSGALAFTWVVMQNAHRFSL